jgi:hypothetical protein
LCTGDTLTAGPRLLGEWSWGAEGKGDSDRWWWRWFAGGGGGRGDEIETSTLEEGGGGGDCDGSTSERGGCPPPLAADRLAFSSGAAAGLFECTRAQSCLSCFMAASIAALSM